MPSSEQFNVNEYWLKRGQAYVQERRVPAEYHRLQERFLLDILRGGGIALGKILEIGCGYGRITKVLAETFPHSRIVALDLSADQLQHARSWCGQAANITFEQYDFYSGAPFPEVGYDVVIAVEVLLHHPRHMVRDLFATLADISRYLVNVDWSEEWPWQTAEHVWVHDYRELYTEAGLESIQFLLPQKVDGKQQKLFVAARKISPELKRLEQRMASTQLIAGVPHGAVPAPNLSDADLWLQQLALAQEEIMELIPAGSAFILVHDDQWGNETPLAGRQVIPFLERHGQYWGPPPDDATAIRELERLRRDGASHIVFAWCSFWWLEHYTGLRGHLRRFFSCVFENQRLVVFQLKQNA